MKGNECQKKVDTRDVTELDDQELSKEHTNKMNTLPKN